jgi:hypothetical protein
MNFLAVIEMESLDGSVRRSIQYPPQKNLRIVHNIVHCSPGFWRFRVIVDDCATRPNLHTIAVNRNLNYHLRGRTNGNVIKCRSRQSDYGRASRAIIGMFVGCRLTRNLLPRASTTGGEAGSRIHSSDLTTKSKRNQIFGTQQVICPMLRCFNFFCKNEFYWWSHSTTTTFTFDAR